MARNYLRARAQAADAMTARLADALGETNARAGLHYYAWTLGPEICEQLLQEALALADAEASEAMQTADGTRRRTAGGIFFTLAKRRADGKGGES